MIELITEMWQWRSTSDSIIIIAFFMLYSPKNVIEANQFLNTTMSFCQYIPFQPYFPYPIIRRIIWIVLLKLEAHKLILILIRLTIHSSCEIRQVEFLFPFPRVVARFGRFLQWISSAAFETMAVNFHIFNLIWRADTRVFSRRDS